MKMFKLVDLIMQTVLITGGIIYGVCSMQKAGMGPIGSYLAVGLWQIISYSIHYFFFTPTIFQHERRHYGKIVLAILLLGVILFIPLLFEIYVTIPFVLIYLIALLICSPLLAIYYLGICWKEYRIMIKRELIHLK